LQRVFHFTFGALEGITIQPMPWLCRLLDAFPPLWTAFDPSSGHVGYVMDKMALAEIFSFSYQFYFQQLRHIH
jgi:hypothetical protein